jgi:hypothetical protein
MMLQCRIHPGRVKTSLILMTGLRRRVVLVIGGFLKSFIPKDRGQRTFQMLKTNGRRHHSIQSHSLQVRAILGPGRLGIGGHLLLQFFVLSRRHHLGNRPMALVSTITPTSRNILKNFTLKNSPHNNTSIQLQLQVLSIQALLQTPRL